MQSRALSVAHVVDRAESMFGHTRVVSAGEETVDVATLVRRVRRLVGALDALGVPEGARVGTLAANHRRHLEVYLAAPVSKRVLHTLNIRLSAAHLEYVVSHAGDDVVFVDRALLPVVLASVERLPRVRHWVVLPDGTDEVPLPRVPSPGRTRTSPRACATPRARPARRRVCSTATARRCCTPSARCSPATSVSSRATS